MLLHLSDEGRGRTVWPVDLDLDGVEDLWQAVGEDRVNYDALDLDDLAGITADALVRIRHSTPRRQLR